MKQEETLRLVERAMAGDEQALAELCEAKGKKILYTAAGIMGNLQDGEEVMQEVLIKVFRNVGKLRQPKYFDLWLYRVVLNECNDLRKKRTQRENDVRIPEEQLHNIPEERTEFLPSEFAEDSEKRELLLAVVEGLRPNYRTAILLHYFDGLTYPQIAAVMGISALSVENTLRRARRKMRAELEQASHTKFENLFAAAPVPVLTRAMEAHADELIPRQAVRDHIARTRAAKKGRAPRVKSAKPSPAAFLAGGVAAVMALGAAIASAGTAPQWNGPLPSSAATAQGVPQQPSDQPAAEEVLEIEEQSSPMAGSDPQSGPAEDGGQAQAAGLAEVRGVLILKDAQGGVVQGADKYLSGVGVNLLDAGGAVLAQTVTDSGGRFGFGDEETPLGAAIQLAGEQGQLSPGKENPAGVRPLGATDGAGEVALFVRKTNVSKVTIEFDGECDCGHVNPKTARAVCADELDTPRGWVITDEAGAAVARGEGDLGKEDFQALPEGRYTLDWTIGDIAGNTAVARRVFRVLDGEVDLTVYE